MAGFWAWVRSLFYVADERRSDTMPCEPLGRPDGSRLFAEGNNDFALAMYVGLREQSRNLFFSPFSIRTALAMTYAGARGETASQMGQVVRLESSGEGMHEAFGEIIQRLNAAGRRTYEMTVANSLWTQDGAPLQAEFLELIAQHYGGGMNRVDFHGGAEAARVEINQWVEDKTKRRIQELIPLGGLDAGTRLLLVNAVYFKGMWVLQFQKAATRDEPFYLEGGGKVQVPLMHQNEPLRYLQGGDFQAVDLDYQDGDLSMLVVLPNKKDGLRDLETKLSASMIHDCVTNMRMREVKLFLPKFRLTWGTVELGAQLRALGMSLAFSRSEADFSGINGHAPLQDESLFISAVFHKAFVDVNEKGTEAAAATGVGLTLSAARIPQKPPKIPVFRADHPFLFAIRDRKSGVILFLGRMTDPTQES